MSVYDQIITLAIKNSSLGSWVFSAIYASPKVEFRHMLWEYLIQLWSYLDVLWLLLGDWNQVFVSAGKKGGHCINCKLAARFWEVLESFYLLDLGFSRPKFTWLNKRKVVIMLFWTDWIGVFVISNGSNFILMFKSDTCLEFKVIIACFWSLQLQLCIILLSRFVCSLYT